MRNEYDLIGDLARSGEDFVLCRVTNTAGSTPRSIGAIMAVRRDGSCIGSVGGGRPEYECAQKAGEMLEKTGEPCEQVLHFNLGDNEYVCGGSMDIEISLIRAGDDEAVRKVLEIADSHRRRRVIIFGGGHVARALVPVLAGIDFDVTVYEERPEFAEKEMFPEAETVICGSFANIQDFIKLEKTDYVAIMTRGHADDYEVLRQVLPAGTDYVGLMGSRSKRRYITERLEGDGFSQKDIDRIHNPIGLSIGSETPQEIAISIAAELIAVRAEK